MGRLNRRQLAFIVLVNGLVSLVIALAVVWVFEIRRPEAEELAAIYGAQPVAVLAATPAPSIPVAAPAVLQPEEPAPDVATATAPETNQSEEIYVVRGGDSLVAIAARYNLSVDQIVEANDLANPDFVFSGQRLIIPVSRLSGSAASTATPVPVQGVEVASIIGAGDLATEAVQVVNDSDRAFSLQGWQLVKEEGPVYTFGDVPLFPGGSVRINTRTGSDNSIDLFWGQSEALWRSGAVARIDKRTRDACAHLFSAIAMGHSPGK